ncbi:transposase [Glutamicibacter ardleyensis]|uniref:transposase n=1 Tax=Glutamicibacter ardleyensis TaxID=225894 RepID=UPI001E6597E2|nr:transposase [Glutamicibacter ardleyensis]
MDALDEQTVVVVGTDAAGLVISHLARQMISLHVQPVDVATHLEAMVETHPLYLVLTSMPGVAVRTAAVIIASDLRQDLHQCSGNGFLRRAAPTTCQSGNSIKSERVSHSGNERLKRALFLSAFASIRFDSTSRAYYDRKRAQCKRHNQALIALAPDVLSSCST